jgi:hypothetical protein
MVMDFQRRHKTSKGDCAPTTTHPDGGASAMTRPYGADASAAAILIRAPTCRV